MTPNGYLTGATYTGYRDAAAIARDIRADLKAADLPREVDGHPVTFGVRSSRFNLGQSVDVTIKGLPDTVTHVDRSHQDAEPEGTSEPAEPWSPTAWLTPAVAELKEAVRTIATAHNRMGVDRRHATYYLDVIVECDQARASTPPSAPGRPGAEPSARRQSGDRPRRCHRARPVGAVGHACFESRAGTRRCPP